MVSQYRFNLHFFLFMSEVLGLSYASGCLLVLYVNTAPLKSVHNVLGMYSLLLFWLHCIPETTIIILNFVISPGITHYHKLLP